MFGVAPINASHRKMAHTHFAPTSANANTLHILQSIFQATELILCETQMQKAQSAKPKMQCVLEIGSWSRDENHINTTLFMLL